MFARDDKFTLSQNIKLSNCTFFCIFEFFGVGPGLIRAVWVWTVSSDFIQFKLRIRRQKRIQINNTLKYHKSS